MIILGIDPGLSTTGYGLIQSTGSKISHLENGGLYPPQGQPLSERLHYLYTQVSALLQRYQVEVLAIEAIFVAKNVSSALKLGHARGVLMLAGKTQGLPVFEYTALQVKNAVTGYGQASKDQVQKMVKALLKIPEVAIPDASDALAVALCHSQSHRFLEKVGKNP